MNKLQKLYYNYLEWQLKIRRKIAFWILGWCNIKKLNVTYVPDKYTEIHLHMEADNIMHTIIDINMQKRNDSSLF